MGLCVVIGGSDRHLMNHLGELVTKAGHRTIRTNKVDRIIKELKQPGRLAIIDVNWEDVQAPGIIRQMVNLGRICDNPVVCICPNRDDELKELARRSRPTEVFLRFDLGGRFPEFLKSL